MSRLYDTLTAIGQRAPRVVPQLDLPRTIVATPTAGRPVAMTAAAAIVLVAVAVGGVMLVIAKRPTAPGTLATVTAAPPSAQTSGRPETLDAVDMRARAREATGRNALADAEGLLERATAAAPADAESWNDLGVVRVRRGHVKKGIEAFERALALQPANAGVRRNLAVALDRDGQGVAAATHYRAFLTLAPQHPDRPAVERRLAAH